MQDPMSGLSIPLPDAIATKGWRGVLVETHLVAGESLHSVIVKARAGGAAKRAWFDRRPAALAFAIEAAERQGLSAFDLGSDDE